MTGNVESLAKDSMSGTMGIESDTKGLNVEKYEEKKNLLTKYENINNGKVFVTGSMQTEISHLTPRSGNINLKSFKGTVA